jgi:hypothetical protein
MRVRPLFFGLMIVALFAATIGLGAALGAWQTAGGPGSSSGGGHGGGRGGGRGDGDTGSFVLPDPAATGGLSLSIAIL